MLPGTAFLDWFKSAMNTYFTVPVYDFKPADITVTLMDESDEAIAVWNVKQAYPVKWAVSDLKAMDNAIMIETIELAYQYFERK